MEIESYRDGIVSTVESNQVTIIVAETGAGKTTQVPQYLFKAGHRVIVTQPRRLACRRVAERVAFEMGEKVGQTVGYWTGEGAVNREASILFSTDGIQSIVTLLGSGGTTNESTILVIDEVHEWNLNIETLLAWVRQHQSENTLPCRVVLMSATLDANSLSAHFDSAPVIDIPGRLFPVESVDKPNTDPVEAARQQAMDGRNVLLFLPGKKEINDAVDRLSDSLGNKSVVYPLHSQLSIEEQDAVFNPPKGKNVVVCATNIAQTSITIDYVDAVVDSGTERRSEMVHGIETLAIGTISTADSRQRAGRAGRCKPGRYVYCGSMDRNAYPVPEIQRLALDQLCLRLLCLGFDPETMPFYHAPNSAALHSAVELLQQIGAVSQELIPTETGRLLNRLPVSPELGATCIEAARRGVLEEVAVIIGAMESDPRIHRADGWRKMSKEKSSELLFLLDVMSRADEMNGSARREAGIHNKHFFEAKETTRKLLKKLERLVANREVEMTDAERRRQISLAFAATSQHRLFMKRGYSFYPVFHTSWNGRELSQNSPLVVSELSFVIGSKFDLQIETRRGKRTIPLLQFVSSVDPKDLPTLNPRFSCRTEYGVETVRLDSVPVFQRYV